MMRRTTTNWNVADTGWTSGDDLEYTISGLDDDVEYDVQVRAVNVEGDGAWSYTDTETALKRRALLPGRNLHYP